MGRFGSRDPVVIGFSMGRFTLAAFATWVVLWVANVFSPSWVGWSLLELDAHATIPGLQLWRLLTYALLQPGGPIGLFFLLIIGYFMIGRFEARWGWWGMLRFYLITTSIPALIWAGAALLHPGGGGPLVGVEPFLAGLIVGYGLIFPDTQFLIFFIFPMRARTVAILSALLAAFLTIYELPHGVGLALLSLLGMGVAFVYLKHGWRLSRLQFFQTLGALPQRVSRWWRRRKVRVVDKNFDRWLDREDDDEVRH